MGYSNYNVGVWIETMVENRVQKIGHKIMADSTTLGGAVIYGLVTLMVLATGEMILFWKLVVGFMLTGGIVVLTRCIYFKDRPIPREHHTFVEKISASSFPSWHTARAVFLTITFIGMFQNRILALVLALIALLVAYSRVYLQRHDWWDVLGGMVLGGGVYWLILWGIVT